MSTFKPHPHLLIDLINAENNKAIPYSVLSLSAPTVNGDIEIDGDTLVTMTSTNTQLYTGSVVASYNRLNLQTLFAAAEIQTLSVRTNAVSTHDLIPAIREAYGLSLFEDDILDTVIVYLGDGTAEVDLVAAPGSYIFTGQIQVAVAPPLPEEIALGEVLVVTVLNGLNYPLMDTDHLTAPAIQVMTLTGTLVEGDGSLLVGEGYSADNFTSVNNSELSMAVAVRVVGNLASVAPEEGVYPIDIAEGSDWELVTSITVPASETTHPITDLYTVSLVLKSVDFPLETVTLNLVSAEDGYSFIAEDETVDLAPGYVSVDRSIVQDVQTLQLLEGYFPSQTRSLAGSLMGGFELSLVARRINSIAPIVRVSVQASVQEQAPE